MSLDYPIIAEGYPVSHNILGFAFVKLGTAITVSAPAGPGELLGWAIFRIQGSVVDFAEICITLTIDGVVIYDGLYYWWMMAYTAYNYHSIFGSSDTMGIWWTPLHFLQVMAYETSAVLKVYTANAVGQDVYVNLFLRQGD